jgi:hypothetical protein
VILELFLRHGADMHAVTIPPDDLEGSESRRSYGLTVADYVAAHGDREALDWCSSHGIMQRDQVSRAGNFGKMDFMRSMFKARE